MLRFHLPRMFVFTFSRIALKFRNAISTVWCLIVEKTLQWLSIQCNSKIYETTCIGFHLLLQQPKNPKNYFLTKLWIKWKFPQFNNMNYNFRFTYLTIPYHRRVQSPRNFCIQLLSHTSVHWNPLSSLANERHIKLWTFKTNAYIIQTPHSLVRRNPLISFTKSIRIKISPEIL